MTFAQLLCKQILILPASLSIQETIFLSKTHKNWFFSGKILASWNHRASVSPIDPHLFPFWSLLVSGPRWSLNHSVFPCPVPSATPSALNKDLVSPSQNCSLQFLIPWASGLFSCWEDHKFKEQEVWTDYYFQTSLQVQKYTGFYFQKKYVFTYLKVRVTDKSGRTNRERSCIAIHSWKVT